MVTGIKWCVGNLNQAKLSPSNAARSDSFASNAARAGSRSVNSSTAPRRWWHRAIFLTATFLNTKIENSFSFPVKSTSHHGQKKIVFLDSETKLTNDLKTIKNGYLIYYKINRHILDALFIIDCGTYYSGDPKTGRVRILKGWLSPFVK